MKLLEQASAIARSGRPEDAVAFIEEAARSGDADGNFLVAHWLLYGSDRPRDTQAAYRHLELAAEKGKPEAVRVLAHLTANGTGCEPDREKALGLLRRAAEADRVAADQLAMLRAMTANTADAARAARDRISADPHIELLRGLLLRAECEYLMRRAEPLLKASFVDERQDRQGQTRSDPDLPWRRFPPARGGSRRAGDKCADRPGNRHQCWPRRGAVRDALHAGAGI